MPCRWPHRFIFLLAITYSTVSPLLVPFAAIYFLFSRFLWRNQLLFVYSERRDSMGSLWPYYMHSILVAVILSQVTNPPPRVRPHTGLLVAPAVAREHLTRVLRRGAVYIDARVANEPGV